MVKGMEKIIATVSGYHGSERLKLIKLITAAGANYVGKMSKSITHLICWKFKGKKYELAKKLGTKVVNHQWLEDCITEGKLIPEHPYALRSGQDVGSIKSDPLVVMEQARPLKENKLLSNKRNIHDCLNNVIDLDSDEIENDDFHVDLLLDENLFPKPGTITTGRKIFKRKLVKETSKGNRQAKADNIRSNYEADVDTVDTFQNEESNYLPKCSHNQTRNPDITIGTEAGESSRRSRRLIKKNTKSGTTRLAVNDTELQSIILADSNDDPPASNIINDSNKLRNEVKTNHVNDIGPRGDTGVESNNITNADGRNLHEISSRNQDSKGQHENKDIPDNSAIVQKSEVLACVICRTDFSSTRGVLPCGHRFCFTCIQKWADELASKRKETTCPLCKNSFASITIVDEAASADQKIYSQTVPCASSLQDIYIVPEAEPIRPNTQIPAPSVCCNCQSLQPVDLLIYCHICQTSCIHCYCLDPPMHPWSCITCRDRRLF